MNRNSLVFLVLLSTFSLFSHNYALAQNEKTISENLNKNIIYADISMGGDHDLFSNMAVYYERALKQNMWNKNISSFINLGVGRRYAYEELSQYIIAQYGLLTGAKSHHLEIATGVKYYYKGDEQGKLPLSSMVGWRFQKPDGLLVLRAGLGYPEIIYFGLGLSF